MTNWETGLPDGLRTRIVHDFDTGQSWNELESEQELNDRITAQTKYASTTPRAPSGLAIKPGSPEAYLYACGEELAEERRAHRETRMRLAEAEGRPSYFGLGFVAGLAFAFFMSAVVTLL